MEVTFLRIPLYQYFINYIVLWLEVTMKSQFELIVCELCMMKYFSTYLLLLFSLSI